MIPNHDEDFYGWAMAEANLVRQRKWEELVEENASRMSIYL